MIPCLNGFQFEILGSDGAQNVRNAIKQSGEPPVPQLKTWYYEQDSGALPTTDFFQLCAKKDEYQAQYQSYWKSTALKTKSGRPVDGVILPIAPSAAVQDNKFTYFGYSAIVNLLDYAAASFPVTFADQATDKKQAKYSPMNEEDKLVYDNYDPQVFHGAPVGLQVMCRRLEEEKALELVEFVANALLTYRNTDRPLKELGP